MYYSYIPYPAYDPYRSIASEDERFFFGLPLVAGLAGGLLGGLTVGAIARPPYPGCCPPFPPPYPVPYGGYPGAFGGYPGAAGIPGGFGGYPTGNINAGIGNFPSQMAIPASPSTGGAPVYNTYYSSPTMQPMQPMQSMQPMQPSK
ncbi:hypothetical protein [Priestia koreensis]|uniref:hypothetical protein n=1 Tax=Priestia koreensis TaxID=284581 RepID=UPI0037CA127A